ncbi:ankyrin repeat and LEM domain-containing 2, partial [Brachionus plicatilis]
PFRDRLIANPRFLITAGDAPVIYQEGFRYNALHVCAKEDRAAFCQIILNLLSSHSFLQKMYPNDTIEQSKARSHHILDLYLNTPEKGLNETPLHFATNTKAINQAAKSNAELIKNLCEKCFYVPLFRDDDKGDVVIEKPSPKLVRTLDKTEFDITKKNFISPGLTRTHSKLAGYVGPVSPNVANEIYERLKSPAKLRRSPLNLDILRSDDYKGYERILRKMTDEMNLPWSEYWAFLDSYCNLKSPDGHEKLEIYLNQKKILNILNSQISSIQTILNDRANNNNFKSENNEENMFMSYLKQFLTIADNFLSLKFEKFLKIRKFCEKKSNAILEENFDDKQIIDSFTQYMSIVIELSRLDKTSKCYFNLYKSSKDLLNTLNLFKFFENFHMSPIFKKIISCSSASRPLSNTTNISTWAMRDPAKKPNKLRKALFNESDDEDEEPKVSDNDSEEENCFGDADDSVIDQLGKNQIKDDMDLLAMKLNSNFLNDSEPKTRKSLNPFEYRKKNEEETFSVKKSSSFRRPMDVGNKLFMYGDSPSKLDRAVFLAIQDSKIDQNKYRMVKLYEKLLKSKN